MSDAMNSSIGFLCQDVHDYFRDDWTQIRIVQVVLYVVYGFVFLTAVIGNTGVLVAICGTDKLQTIRNVFIANLAFADTLLVLCCMPFTAHGLIWKVWIFGRTMCHLIPFLQGFSVLISAASMCIVALDRYVLITQPNRFQPINRRYAMYILLSTWALSATICCPIALFQAQISGRELLFHVRDIFFCDQFCMEHWPNKRASNAYFAVLLCLQYILPGLLTAFCYYRISGTAQASQVSVRRMAAMSNGHRKRVSRKSKRLNRLLASIVSVYAICWLPQNVLNILRDAESLPTFVSEQEFFFSLLVHCISMLPTVANPLLYVIGNVDFRAHAFRPVTLSFGSSIQEGTTTDGSVKRSPKAKSANGYRRQKCKPKSKACRTETNSTVVIHLDNYGPDVRL